MDDRENWRILATNAVRDAFACDQAGDNDGAELARAVADYWLEKITTREAWT